MIENKSSPRSSISDLLYGVLRRSVGGKDQNNSGRLDLPCRMSIFETANEAMSGPERSGRAKTRLSTSHSSGNYDYPSICKANHYHISHKT